MTAKGTPYLWNGLEVLGYSDSSSGFWIEYFLNGLWIKRPVPKSECTPNPNNKNLVNKSPSGEVA